MSARNTASVLKPSYGNTQHSAPQSLVMRACIILLASVGVGVRERAQALQIGRTTVQRWRARWRASNAKPFTQRLCDEPRPGTPPTYQPEQICQIIALACEPPGESGRPFTNWTHEGLATASREKGIVERISGNPVGRFLREVDLEPTASVAESTRLAMASLRPNAPMFAGPISSPPNGRAPGSRRAASMR